MKRSAKPKHEQPFQEPDATIQTHPAPEAAERSVFPDLSALRGSLPIDNGISPAESGPDPTPPTKPVYEWDRTIAEDAERQEQIRISKTPFPVPPNTTLPFPELCAYCNALWELPVGRYARLYLARWWPELLPVETFDDFGNPKDSFPNDLDKPITAKDGPLSQQFILQAAGAGEYRLRLNDSRRPWKQQTIVFSELEITDRSLWTLNPPIIDPKRLNMDAKRNQAYIKFARAHGYLPREGVEEKEQTEMAQVTQMDSVLEDSRRERARADQIQREQIERAEREAKEAREAAARATAAQVSPAKTGAAAELESVGNVITSLANAIKPAPDTSLSDYLKLQTEREKTEREREREERQTARDAAAAERARADQLQADILKELREKAATPPALTNPATAPPITKLSVLKDAVEEQTLLKQLTGRGGHAEEEKEVDLDKYLAFATALGPIAQSIIGGMFQTIQYGLQTWQNVAHNNALIKTSGATPVPHEPVKPTPAPPTLTPEQQAQQNHLAFMLKTLDTAAIPIGKSFSDGDSGAVFAAMVIKLYGRPTYDLIRSLGQTGPEQFSVEQFVNSVRALLMHPARTAAIAKLANETLDKPTFKKFLEDCFNYDAIAAEEERREQEDQ